MNLIVHPEHRHLPEDAPVLELFLFLKCNIYLYPDKGPQGLRRGWEIWWVIVRTLLNYAKSCSRLGESFIFMEFQVHEAKHAVWFMLKNHAPA